MIVQQLQAATVPKRPLSTMVHPRKRTLRWATKADDHVQLYRPKGPFIEAHELLERTRITDQDIINFCTGEEALIGPVTLDPQHLEYLAEVEEDRAHRKEIQELKRKFAIGEARIDDDGNLVPVESARPPGIQLPPPPPQRPNADVGGNQPAGNNEEAEQQWMDQEKREATAAIARAVQRYREQGVAAQDLQLVRIPDDGERTNFTFRRICCAVLTVVAAFICILLETLPIMQSLRLMDPTFDNLMPELLHVKHMGPHSLECPGLHRENNLSWPDRIRQLAMGQTDAVDCSDGVLHIPAQSVLINQFVKTKSRQEVAMLEPFVSDGVQASWFLTCQPPPAINANEDQQQQSSCYPGSPTVDKGVCFSSNRRCFRGVHDDLVSEREVALAIAMGARLIRSGGDHFDIHYNTDFLSDWVPTVLTKLKQLLRDTYHLSNSDSSNNTRLLEPVAFRISAAAPMNADGVPIYSPGEMTPVLNRSNYVDWLVKTNRQNEYADTSVPWPFRTEPVRDTCHLLADLQADARFAVQTTVFLSDGAGGQYRGGASLYVDYHASNADPRRKIRRGLTVDGTRGRVVVSTGGLENRRCRLPTRAGVRIALQIWWSC